MKRSLSRGFTLVELMVVIGILGLLVGILAVAVIPKLTEAQAKLEQKQLGDLMSALQEATIDAANKKALVSPALKDAKGQKFYEQAIKRRILNTEVVNKLVSLNSKRGDTKAGTEWIESGEMPPNSVSYTSPKGSDLIRVLGLSGANKTIVLCFDSGNWLNYENSGTLVYWSDADQSEYMTKETAQELYQIDNETWTNNPKDIIGNKKPFNLTFE